MSGTIQVNEQRLIFLLSNLPTLIITKNEWQSESRPRTRTGPLSTLSEVSYRVPKVFRKISELFNMSWAYVDFLHRGKFYHAVLFTRSNETMNSADEKYHDNFGDLETYTL